MILATRGSALAMAQAALVKEKLEKAGEAVTFLPVTTKGDRNRHLPLTEIGGDGLFVRELEAVLLSGEADLAVHSAKDLPFRPAEGLMIAGIPEAGDPRDCLLQNADAGAGPGRQDPEEENGGTGRFVVGTGSPRRRIQFQDLAPTAEFAELRGNVNTRIVRLREGAYDGIILAKAGLDRLKPDLGGLTVEAFPPEAMIPAPCQGILAAECRCGDRRTAEILERITDPEALRRFRAERYLFEHMKADCSVPVGVYADFQGDRVTIRALLGKRRSIKEGAASEYRRLCEEILREVGAP